MDTRDLVGTWKLVSWTAIRSDGTVVEPFGPEPEGMVLYGEDGFMSGQMMRRERPGFAQPRSTAADTAGGTAEEIVAAFNGYLAYCGRYSLAAGQVTHHLECSLLPDWVSTDLRRTVELNGDTLTLRTPAVETPAGPQSGVLVWRRA